jgi:hypothetical protein
VLSQAAHLDEQYTVFGEVRHRRARRTSRLA